MSRIVQTQLFLFVLVLGFLTGPRVIQALQGKDAKEDAPVVLHGEIPMPEIASVVVARKPKVDPYATLALSARSVYVWDIHERKKLYAKNADEKLPLASVAKMMTALVATENMSTGTLVSVTANDLLEEGDTGLLVGEKWTIDDLIQFTLTASSNDGASAIGNSVGNVIDPLASAQGKTHTAFVEKMNQKAREIGLLQSIYFNESGLDESATKGGAYGSARDMAMLFEYVFRKHPAIFTSSARGMLDIRSASGVMHHAQNTNQDVENISGIIGSKTGFTNLAGGNLVVVVDIGVNHPVVISVLGSTREERFSDVKKLIAATTDVITTHTP